MSPPRIGAEDKPYCLPMTPCSYDSATAELFTARLPFHQSRQGTFDSGPSSHAGFCRAGRAEKKQLLPNRNKRMTFDAMAAALDWLDAFRAGNIEAILEMFADDGAIACACGGIKHIS